MAKKQAELPGTRRDDEPQPKSIPKLDDACEILEKAKGGHIKSGQKVVEAKQAIDELLRENGITSYVYEDTKGVERKVFISESIKTAKIRKDTDGGDEE
jgi:hypothetical protein